MGGDTMYQQKYNDLKLGERGAIISIITYICLSALKVNGWLICRIRKP